VHKRGEYREEILVTAVRLEQTGPRSIVADGVEIVFGEDILDIEIISNGK
jgi:predicted transcriptional regulator